MSSQLQAELERSVGTGSALTVPKDPANPRPLRTLS